MGVIFLVQWLKMKSFIFFLIIIFKSVTCQEYQFIGKHLVASYYECDEKAIVDIDALKDIMIKAAKDSYATVSDFCCYKFQGDGFSMVILLSESHASIHTYPEYNSCFVDFFTCGTDCLPENFDKTMREYLQPQKIKSKLFFRDEEIIREHFPPQESSKNFIKEFVKNLVKK